MPKLRLAPDLLRLLELLGACVLFGVGFCVVGACVLLLLVLLELLVAGVGDASAKPATARATAAANRTPRATTPLGARDIMVRMADQLSVCVC